MVYTAACIIVFSFFVPIFLAFCSGAKQIADLVLTPDTRPATPAPDAREVLAKIKASPDEAQRILNEYYARKNARNNTPEC